VLPKLWTLLEEVGLFPYLSALTVSNLPSGLEREQIWVNAGFQEQLSLFEMCRYAPSMEEGIYVRWRQNLDQRLQSLYQTRSL
jgi:hypothetical protein